jgi:hypothetical protein
MVRDRSTNLRLRLDSSGAKSSPEKSNNGIGLIGDQNNTYSTYSNREELCHLEADYKLAHLVGVAIFTQTPHPKPLIALLASPTQRFVISTAFISRPRTVFGQHLRHYKLGCPMSQTEMEIANS